MRDIAESGAGAHTARLLDLPENCGRVLNRLAFGVPCGKRIEWTMRTKHLSELDAADFVARSFAECGACLKPVAVQPTAAPTWPPPIAAKYNGFSGMYQALPGIAEGLGDDVGSYTGSVEDCSKVCDNNDLCNSFSYCDGVCYLKTAVLNPDGRYAAHDTCSSWLRVDSARRKGSPCGLRQAPPPAPRLATELNGVKWPELCFIGKSEEHMFLIGDWGGLEPAGSGEPKVADNTRSKQHPRGFYWGTDNRAQSLVAEHMRKQAKLSNPRFVLNVGDNFYWGGIRQRCGQPANVISPSTDRQFVKVFENVYKGPGLDGKPWFGVLGNHDYGGFVFTSGWDQQIAYTWGRRGRWIMPGQYWSQHVKYPDQDMSLDIFLIDNNHNDAKSPGEDPEHNICSGSHNSWSATCGATGPSGVGDCRGWFHRLWARTLPWLEDGLNRSAADWQIVVSHFPPERWYDGRRFPQLAKVYGIDLWVAGHRHTQEVHHLSKMGVTYVITGGGGGVTSEGLPSRSAPDYGYMDVAITKSELRIDSFRFRRAQHWFKETTVVPRRDRWVPSDCDKVLDVALSDGGTCGSHLRHLVSNEHLSEHEARDRLAAEFPIECGVCGSIDAEANVTVANATDGPLNEELSLVAAATPKSEVMDYYNTAFAAEARCYTDPGSGDGMGVQVINADSSIDSNMPL
eukprot:TRINITY_DN8010_c0_g1_i6.p1 TRINITY_DN8010_c0_g1~~TRINITY_DN8010_c0_g1_i6.p1  ORF type:complete len:682 (-),score=105.34 TRINITY_DN8010_c0_g1_i6:135-2180(-)